MIITNTWEWWGWIKGAPKLLPYLLWWQNNWIEILSGQTNIQRGSKQGTWWKKDRVAALKHKTFFCDLPTLPVCLHTQIGSSICTVYMYLVQLKYPLTCASNVQQKTRCCCQSPVSGYVGKSRQYDAKMPCLDFYWFLNIKNFLLILPSWSDQNEECID